MADLTPPVFTLLPRRDPENVDEVPIYDCSLCDLDVFNISGHAWTDHGFREFTVVHEETPRDFGTVGHKCGINGCSFDGNHDGLHSWQLTEVPDGS